LPHLKSLLKESQFSQLKVLNLCIPVATFDDLETTMLLVQFLQNHPKLKKLYLTIEFPEEYNPIDRRTYVNDSMKIIDAVGKSDWGNIKVVNIEGKNVLGTYPHTEIWKEFIRKPSSLEKVGLKIGPLSNDLIRTICSRNGSTLNELYLDNFINEFETEGQSDLNIFSELQSIRKLQFTGKQFISGSESLPTTIEELIVSGAMRSEESDHILLNQPNIKNIVLLDVRNDQEGYGVKPETLHKFVENRKVNELYLLVAGHGERLPAQEIPNGDPVNPVMLTIGTGHMGSHWKLNQAGYYTNVERRL